MFNYLVIAVGGALGALLRSFVYKLFAENHTPHWFPIPTITVNVVGSILIGIGWYCLIEKAMLPPIWKNFAITGMLGALTTFSTFSLDAFRLIQNDQPLEAVAYILASVLLCLFGTWAGYQSIRFFV